MGGTSCTATKRSERSLILYFFSGDVPVHSWFSRPVSGVVVELPRTETAPAVVSSDGSARGERTRSVQRTGPGGYRSPAHIRIVALTEPSALSTVGGEPEYSPDSGVRE